MNSVTVSQKFQVVIPLQVRRSLGLKAGQKMIVLAYDNRIVLVLERPIQEARGSLKGFDNDPGREDEDRP